MSRYIREGDDSDVQVFWRALAEGKPAEDTPTPNRRELCRVSLASFAKFLGAKSKPKVFVWNALHERWQRADRPRPGSIYLIELESGGYSDELGWTREPGDKPTAIMTQGETPESYDADRETFLGRWISIQDHTSDVIAATRILISAISLSKNESDALETAALWHDVGKAHPIFQQMLRDGRTPPAGDGIVWAKSASGKGRPTRKGFRHELASAIAWLIGGPVDATERDLVGFLIAAHHGKVRLSIRALPDEGAPDGPDCLHARGIWDGDELPAFALPGVAVGPIRLSLSFMQMGDGPRGSSWLSRALALRDRLGPFRLAYLETLLRVADMRASARETSNPRPCIL